MARRPIVVVYSLWAQQIFKEQRVSPVTLWSWVGIRLTDPQQLQWKKEAGLNVAGFGRVQDLPVMRRQAFGLCF
jgi:hypothetical protein